MKTLVLLEAGYDEAMFGLSLSRNRPVESMPTVAERLYDLDWGHNKFLESMAIWLDITAPRYWWQQFDTYRIGMTKQSESSMYTILHRLLTQKDFQRPIAQNTLDRLNGLIADKCFDQLKVELPEGFLQRRIACTNYQTLRRILKQRASHRLSEWREFCKEILQLVEHPELLPELRVVE